MDEDTDDENDDGEDDGDEQEEDENAVDEVQGGDSVGEVTEREDEDENSLLSQANDFSDPAPIRFRRVARRVIRRVGRLRPPCVSKSKSSFST